MSASVVCPGCGRPVRLTAGVVLRRAKCSKCRARLLTPGPGRSRPRADAAGRLPELALPPVAPAVDQAPVAPVADPPPSASPVITPVGSTGPRPPPSGPSDIPARTPDSVLGTPSVLGIPHSVPGTRSPLPLSLDDEPATRRRWPALLGGVATAVALVAFGAVAYLAGIRDATPPEGPAPEPIASPAPGPDIPGPPPTPPTAPPSVLDQVYRTGSGRLDDGPAEVTALALSPGDGAVVVGYADGSTRVWSLDQPAFEAPRPGPRADGPVRRISLDPAGRVAYLHTDRGLTAAALRNPPRSPVVLPGDPAAVFFEPDRERFAAVNDGRVRVRYVPTGLIAAPPPARAVGGFVTSVSQDEVLPLGVPPAPAPLPGRPTFVAWHPAGRVYCGMPDGAIRTWPGAAPQSAVVSREHRAAVRAWAAARDDFATGDDAGVVGYWPNRSAFPIPFRATAAPVRQLDFAPCSGDLLVVDAAGGVAVWDPEAGVKRHELRRPGAAAAAAFGPGDDIVMLADGRGVEVVWLAATKR